MINEKQPRAVYWTKHLYPTVNIVYEVTIKYDEIQLH